ncbi:Mis18-binding protein 1 [Collichthys lucidus]|uniref:Mis18-binding protein 1 n=1 Tax=Collichthys lucidus TaxID=240159 RepID=A0A4U5VEI4_COLLU|nr:Mis18-binding protein 1 [Collichthys lucidus]
MASYQHLLQHPAPRLESPAKVFAKLKSKVQKEELWSVRERHRAELRTPRKTSESTWTDEPKENHRTPRKTSESTWTDEPKENHRTPRKTSGSTWTDEPKENHRTPRKTFGSTWTDEPKDNRRFGSHRDEAQALTLSPISSPQKTFGYADTSSTQRQRKGAFMESTAMSQPSFLVNRKQIHTDPPQFRDMGGFNASSTTPVKIQPVNNDSVGEEFEEASPAFKFSPMKRRLRKRQWEPLEVNTVSSSTKEFSSEATSQAREMETSSAFREDDTHIEACMEDLGPVRGFTAEPSEMNPPPRSIAKKSKMFAYMKERENKSEQQDVQKVSSSTRDLFGDDVNSSRDTPHSTDHSTGETEDVTPSVSQSVSPATQSGVDSADSQSYTDPSEDTLIPAVQAQPILLEDPLVLNSPRVSIPKTNNAVFKRNKWPQRKFPSESVVYLKKWFLRRGPTGMFVDGIHREDNIPWNSNIIVERFSNYVLKTVTGKVYILVGKMNLGVDSGLPKWFLKKFLNGFPPNWKELYEKFLSESSEGQGRETKMNSEAKDIKAKTKSEASSTNISMKRHNEKTFKTPDFCPPASLSSAKVSRSGRVIKPPLEYWKGGRVTLDAHMNVTVHECYDTTICNPEVTTQVSARASQKPARVFLPCSEGRKQCEPSSDEQASAPVRKVKASVRNRNRVKAKPDDKPTYSPEPPVETLSSPEECKKQADKGKNKLIPQEQAEDKWTETELMKLQEAVSFYPKNIAGYWAKVAKVVGTRSAEECHNQHTAHGSSEAPTSKAKKPKKNKVEAPKNTVTDHPVISARVGTLKRKQQVREFLETMPKENVDDVFSSAYMQNKRFEIPSMCPSEDQDFSLSDMEPLTPMSTRFPEIKTPQCLHITPGMMGSPNRSNNDKYVYQLQKRMKKKQFNACKQASSSKNFSPTPSVKRTMKRCVNTENDAFVVWEMFPGKDEALSESGEEDFYFADND